MSGAGQVHHVKVSQRNFLSPLQSNAGVPFQMRSGGVHMFDPVDQTSSAYRFSSSQFQQ